MFECDEGLGEDYVYLVEFIFYLYGGELVVVV